MNSSSLRYLAALSLVACLVACGGGGSAPPAEAPPPQPPPLTVNLALTGTHIVKLRSQGNAWMALAEKPRPHQDNTEPDRRVLIAAPGATATREFRAPEGWSLIDAALHPSGEVSVVLATRQRLRLLRLDGRAQVVGDAELVDPQAATDPIYLETGPYAHDSEALLPITTRDAVRIAPAGEALVLALRSGRQATIAYRLLQGRPGGLTIAWRTLVEPGVYIHGESFRGGGTYDPFAGMEIQFHLALDTDAAGRVGIAMGTSRTELVFGHHAHFGPGRLPAGLEHGILLTQLDANGQRTSTTAIDTQQMSELHGLRWTGGRWTMTGRVRTEQREDGTGWDAFVAAVAPGAAVPAIYRVLDVDRGDLLFDAQSLADGRLLMTGVTGYWQNPTGRSVSEDASPLAVVTAGDGTALRRLNLPAGPRQNQVRAVAGWGGQWWAGGMEDGPGTHSDDADRSGVRSNGYLRALAL